MAALRLLCLLLLAVTPGALAVGNSRYHSAKCLAMRRKCDKGLERNSGSCKAGLPARGQSDRCKHLACAWCEVDGKRDIYPCSTRVVSRICELKRKKPKNTIKPAPTQEAAKPPKTEPPTTKTMAPTTTTMAPTTTKTTKAPTTTKTTMAPTTTEASSGGGPKSPGCTYMGDSAIVIDLGKVAPRDGWTRVTREGIRGLEFLANDKNTGIVSGGTRGKYCFNVKSSMGGDFLLTARTSSPHNVDHNDLWASSSKGFKLLRDGKFNDKRPLPNEFVKGYQNYGNNKIADILRTIDFQPHWMIVPNVREKEAFQVCISGRSTRFSVYSLALVSCKGLGCTMEDVRNTFTWKGSMCS